MVIFALVFLPVVLSGACSAASGGTQDAGAACITFELASGDLACSTDTDCSFVATGVVCFMDNDACLSSVPANVSAATRFAKATSSLPPDCTGFCPYCGWQPCCLSSQCAICCSANPANPTDAANGCGDGATPE